MKSEKASAIYASFFAGFIVGIVTIWFAIKVSTVKEGPTPKHTVTIDTVNTDTSFAGVYIDSMYINPMVDSIQISTNSVGGSGYLYIDSILSSPIEPVKPKKKKRSNVVIGEAGIIGDDPNYRVYDGTNWRGKTWNPDLIRAEYPLYVKYNNDGTYIVCFDTAYGKPIRKESFVYDSSMASLFVPVDPYEGSGTLLVDTAWVDGDLFYYRLSGSDSIHVKSIK